MKAFVCMIMMACAVGLSSCASAGKSVTGEEAVRLMDEGRVDEAISALEKLAAKGEDRAMVQLGCYYYEGTGVKQDYSKSMDWFLQAFAKHNADAFVNLGVMHRESLVYEIDHPVKPAPCEWGKWRKPVYVLKDGMEKFGLLAGGKPGAKSILPPANAPELRFKVVKE